MTKAPLHENSAFPNVFHPPSRVVHCDCGAVMTQRNLFGEWSPDRCKACRERSETGDRT